MTRTTTALRDVAHQPALFTIFTNNRGQIGGLRRPDPVARHRPSPGGRHRVEKGLTPEQVNKAGAVFRAEESKLRRRAELAAKQRRLNVERQAERRASKAGKRLIAKRRPKQAVEVAERFAEPKKRRQKEKVEPKIADRLAEPFH